MKLPGTSSSPLAYKWLSWGLVLAFAYYWLMTFGLVMCGNKVSSALPDQSFLYRSFARQSWRMFAYAKVYNRQMLLITRDTAGSSKPDTTDMVQYLLAKKRASAPFNNAPEAYERILYMAMNGVERRILFHETKIKDSLPGKTDTFYRQQAIAVVNSDSAHQQEINSLAGYARYVMQLQKAGTNGKEYQLIIQYKYIPPSKPVNPTVPGGDEQLIFISDYKPL